MRESELEGAELYGSEGIQLGVVERVLFHPSEPRAIGLMIRPIPWLYFITRRPAFVAWEAFGIQKGHLRFGQRKLPSRRKASQAMGHDVDRTIIWRGMTVRTETGQESGSVADVEMDSTGAVRGIVVSPGGVAGITRGSIDVPGSMVNGFDGRAVVVTTAALALEASGGLADKASDGVAKVKQTASAAAGAAGDALVGAGYATGKAIRSAVRSQPAKKARSAWTGLADSFREGLHEDEPHK